MLLMEQSFAEKHYSVWIPRAKVYNNLQALAWVNRGCQPSGYLSREEEVSTAPSVCFGTRHMCSGKHPLDVCTLCRHGRGTCSPH